MARPRPTIRRRRVAREVKRLMEAAGRKPSDLAALLECQMPKVYKPAAIIPVAPAAKVEGEVAPKVENKQ